MAFLIQKMRKIIIQKTQRFNCLPINFIQGSGLVIVSFLSLHFLCFTERQAEKQ